LAIDQLENLYGVTSGSSSADVFKLTPSGKETILFTFPTVVTIGTLSIDNQGNLYGTNQSGGEFRQGSVFRITPSGVETDVYSFHGSDGANPFSTLIFDAQGNLYGTTISGGDFDVGTVFQLTPTGRLTTLHSFKGGSDGAYPGGQGFLIGLNEFDSRPLVFDKKGNLYGTTAQGGRANTGADNFGTVFKLTPSGIESVLFSFGSVSFSNNPDVNAGLVIDDQENLYGTTALGGIDISNGSVYQVTPEGNFKEILAFSADESEGALPFCGLSIDAHGVMYGATVGGGALAGGTVYS
jgi:uncharacterized repeat protein (TIGR03803 family)